VETVAEAPEQRADINDIKIKVQDKTLIVGVNDMGKSVLMRYLIKRFLDSGVKAFIYDSEHQHNFTHPNAQIYKPRDPGNRDEFDGICKAIWESDFQGVFAIESVDFYAKPKKDLTPNFAKIIHWGRGKYKGVLSTSRRAANVHNDVCALNRTWFLFHTYLPNDVKWLKGFIGKVADDMSEIDPYFFIHWKGGKNGKGRLCNPIPEEDTEIG